MAHPHKKVPHQRSLNELCRWPIAPSSAVRKALDECSEAFVSLTCDRGAQRAKDLLGTTATGAKPPPSWCASAPPPWMTFYRCV